LVVCVTVLWVCALWMGLSAGQAGAAGQAEGPQMAEDVFKNVRLLRGIPVDEFMDTMGMFAAATGMNCTDCHIEESGGSWARYADDNALKQKTRAMIVMVNTLNRTYFEGRREVTCYSCHNGGRRPRANPSLALQYAVDPLIDDPYEILQPPPGAPSIDAVLGRYVQALGGAARLAGLTSFSAKGSYRGFDDFDMYPLEIFASAPGQRAIVQHSQYGDITTTFDGRAAWMAAPTEVRPMPVMALTGHNLAGLGIEAELAFAGRIGQVLGQWVVGPLSVIGDRDARMVQGRKPGGPPVTLYFDEESGLLVRLVRWSESPVGRVPTQIDYEDYREVSGVKLPFKWTSTWTDGRTVFELNAVEANVTIDPARFGRPTPPRATAR
jgi:hypothetical protein